MALTPGTRIGSYEIAAQIGVGGMGEVYRATDTKLKREVAIKVLPDAVAGDAVRLARFQREAEVLAALNHPGIAQIYGLEDAQSSKALVMELVEGPTLADRIAEGPVPVDEAVPIARQIVEALEAAHEQGIVHRDLKPANVKVRPDGAVKVLDFGLAKAMEPASVHGAAAGQSMAPTITTPAMTQAGLVLGTAAYMAPEQARGKPVDRRADIWAFGCVLYEMLTGTRAFPGDDVADTLASVVKLNPNWEGLGPDVPSRLRQVLRVCLQKNPQQRGGDMAAIRLAMDGAFETAAAAPSGVVPGPDLRFWQRPLPAASIVLGLVVVVALGVWALTRPEVVPEGVVRFVIVPPDDAPLSLASALSDLAISSDGRQIVYRGPTSEGGLPQLHLYRVDQAVAEPLRGAENAAAPFFSPDGASVGFVNSDGITKLSKVSTFGGPSTLLAEAPGGIIGASWSTDDRIVFGRGDAGLALVPAGGGEPVAVTTLDSDRGEVNHLWPSWIPGRDAVVFVINTGTALTTGQLAVVDLDTRVVTRLGLAGVSPRYVPTGHLVYAAEDGSVWAVPFDVSALRVAGNPMPQLEGLVVKQVGAANFDVSATGDLVYVLGAEGGNALQRLVWVNREGQEEPTGAPPAPYTYPRISPDGQRAALDVRGDDDAIWTWDIADNTRTRFDLGDGPSRWPVWTRNGARIAAAVNRAIAWKASNNTGTVQRLAEPASEGSGRPAVYFFTPDDAFLVVRDQGNSETSDDLVMIRLENNEPVWRLAGEFRERNPELSPDGHWMVYQSDESGEWQVYVRPFPEVDADQVTVSTDGGVMPLWSRDGRELFYLRPGVPGKLMSVSVETGGPDEPFALGERTELFDFPYFIGIDGRTYDVSDDGSFLVIDSAAATSRDAERPEIDVVLNWGELLKTRVPVP